MKKIKVAYLMHGIGWGGAGGSLLLLLKSIENKVEKHFFTTIDRNSKVREEFVNNVNYYNVYKTRHLYNDQAGGYTPITDFKEILKIDHSLLIDYLNNNEIDILHVNSIVLCHVLPQVKAKTNVKIVMHVRELIPKYDEGEVQSYIIETIKNYSDAIICISTNEAKPFKNLHNLQIIPNPFDFRMCNAVTEYGLRKKNNLPEETILIGMGGQFSVSRGHALFIDAINYAVSYDEKIFSNVKFVIFGVKFNPRWKVMIKKGLKRMDLGDAFLKKIKKYNLENEVIILPYLYTTEYFSVLNEINIYVRPSLAGDPWGRDIIEAMAFGKPIIATGSSDFFVKPRVNGLLVSEINFQTLGNAIISLLRNKTNIITYGQNSKKISRELCNYEEYGNKIITIYKELKNGN